MIGGRVRRLALAIALPIAAFLVFQGILRLVFGALESGHSLVTSTAAAQELEDRLKDELLPSSEELGIALRTSRSVDPREIFGGIGAFFDAMRDRGVAASVMAEYDVNGSADLPLAIRLTLVRNQGMSEEMAKPEQGLLSMPLDRSTGIPASWVSQAADGGALYGSFHKGALLVEMRLDSVEGMTADQGVELLQALVSAQAALVVAERDLRPGNIPLLGSPTLGMLLYGGLLATLLAAWQAIRWANRPSRVRIPQTVNRIPYAGSRVDVHDITKSAARIRRESLRGWILRSAIYVVIAMLTYRLGLANDVVLGFATGLTLLAVLFQIWTDRTASRRRPDVPRPGRGAFLGEAGATALWMVGLSLVAVGALAPLIGLPGDETSTQTQAVVLLIVGGVGFLLTGGWLQSRVRRWAAPTLAEALARDDRAPVLLLRSFGDDSITMPLTRTSDMPLLERVSAARSTFERILVWALSSVGPVIAVAQPGVTLKPLGAARAVHADHEWQEAVEAYLLSAQSVVFIVGNTWGWGWEVRKVVELDLLRKCVFVLPPVARKEAADRLATLGEALGRPVADLLDVWDSVVMLRLGGIGDVEVFASSVRDDCAYRAACDIAVRGLAASP